MRLLRLQNAERQVRRIKLSQAHLSQPSASYHGNRIKTEAAKANLVRATDAGRAAAKLWLAEDAVVGAQLSCLQVEAAMQPESRLLERSKKGLGFRLLCRGFRI